MAKIDTPCGNGFRFYYRGNRRDLIEILHAVRQFEVNESDEEKKDSPIMTYSDDSITPVFNGG